MIKVKDDKTIQLTTGGTLFAPIKSDVFKGWVDFKTLPNKRVSYEIKFTGYLPKVEGEEAAKTQMYGPIFIGEFECNHEENILLKCSEHFIAQDGNDNWEIFGLEKTV